MSRLYMWMTVPIAVAATGCLNVPTLETIVPQHGFVDGCTDVTVQGHHMGDAALLTLTDGTNSVDVELTPPEFDDAKPAHAQDIGFLFTGTTPAGELAAGTGGFYDAVLTVDGVESVLSEGWYFRNCPGSVSVELEIFPKVTMGDSSIFMEGCGMDAATVTATIYDAKCAEIAADVALTSVCGSAQTTLTLPGLKDGDYSYTLVDGADEEYDFGIAADAKKGTCQGLPFTVGATK